MGSNPVVASKGDVHIDNEKYQYEQRQYNCFSSRAVTSSFKFDFQLPVLLLVPVQNLSLLQTQILIRSTHRFTAPKSSMSLF